MSFFGAIKVAKEMMLAGVMNTRRPALHCLAPRRAEEFALAVLVGAAKILPIQRDRYVSEIFQSVIRAIPVDVINVSGRPSFMDQRPNQSMCRNRPDWRGDALVTMSGGVSDLLPKRAGFRIVVEVFAELRDVVSHFSILSIPVVPAKVGMNHPFAPSS